MGNHQKTTEILLKYGFLIRGFVVGISLCLLYKFDTIELGQKHSVEGTPLLFLGLMLIGTFGAGSGSIIFAPFWQKITPIKDRSTYFENEIVFAGSSLLGTSFIIYVFVMVPPLEAIYTVALALAATSPVMLLLWRLISRLRPLEEKHTAEQLDAFQEFQAQTQHYWRNGLAYISASLTTAMTVLALLYAILISKGTIIHTGAALSTALGMTIMFIIISPVLLGIGRKVFRNDETPKGRHYAVGGIGLITVLLVINAKGIIPDGTFQSGVFNAEAAMTAWPIIVTYFMFALSFLLGGLVFSLLYKPTPISLEFR